MSLQWLTDYYSRFSPIVLWLEDQEFISPLETDEYFWYGLPKKIQRRILRQSDLTDRMILPMERAFKKAHHVVKEMLEEDKDDLLGWPSVVEPNGPVEGLMDRGISDKSMQVAEVEQELQGFEDGEESWEVRVVGDDDVARVILGYFDEVTLNVEEIEAMETQGSADKEESELARDGDVPELEDMPALVERLPAVDEQLPTAIERAAIEDAFQNVPAAAKVVLESDEDELAAGEEMLASYDTLAVDDNVPARCNKFPEPTAIEHLPTAIEDKLAAAKEILASNDPFAMGNDIPAECNELPEGEAMLVSYKKTPASKRVVLDNLSVLGGLWSLQDGCAVLLASVFGPACKVFAYRKVRKKKSHRKTTTH